jgi:hypothetical protein
MSVQEMIRLLSKFPPHAGVEITLHTEDDSEIFGFKIEHLEVDGLNDFFDEENAVRFDVFTKP